MQYLTNLGHRNAALKVIKEKADANKTGNGNTTSGSDQKSGSANSANGYKIRHSAGEIE